MTTQDLLSTLQAIGVELSVVGDRLRYGCGQGVLNDSLKAEVKLRKAEIVAILGTKVPTPTTGDGQARNTATPAASGDAKLPVGNELRHESPALQTPGKPSASGVAQRDSQPSGVPQTSDTSAPSWVEIESEILGEHVVVAPTWEAVPAAQAANPELVVYGPGELERLHAWLRAVHAAKRTFGGVIQAPTVAEANIDDVDDRHAPPNPIVHAMLGLALARHDRHAAPRLSMTGWLREHAPEVAALWPEATSQASWFDWEPKVGQQHLAKLDEAYAAVFRRCTGLNLAQWPQNEEGEP